VGALKKGGYPMKWFLISLIFFAAAAALSRHWLNESASMFPTPQQQAGAAPLPGKLSDKK